MTAPPPSLAFCAASLPGAPGSIFYLGLGVALGHLAGGAPLTREGDLAWPAGVAADAIVATSATPPRHRTESAPAILPPGFAPQTDCSPRFGIALRLDPFPRNTLRGKRTTDYERLLGLSGGQSFFPKRKHYCGYCLMAVTCSPVNLTKMVLSGGCP